MLKRTIQLFVLLAMAGCGKDSAPGSSDPVNLTCTYANTFTDPRDNKVYPVIVIGSQTWMAKNLDYEVAGSWCNNCAEYGRLYDWQTALTVAPPGWHLPSVEEWEELVNTLGGYEVAGGKLKYVTGWKDPNSGATNSYCFSALPAEFRANDGSLIGVKENTAYWSTLESGAEISKAFLLGALYSKIQKSDFSKAWGLSVRCIKN
jgi:uncharacterized protein (TIGR02145 family)